MIPPPICKPLWWSDRIELEILWGWRSPPSKRTLDLGFTSVFRNKFKFGGVLLVKIGVIESPSVFFVDSMWMSQGLCPGFKWAPHLWMVRLVPQELVEMNGSWPGYPRLSNAPSEIKNCPPLNPNISPHGFDFWVYLLMQAETMVDTREEGWYGSEFSWQRCTLKTWTPLHTSGQPSLGHICLKCRVSGVAKSEKELWMDVKRFT